ncbi:SIS domain-containing protein [Aeromicrobium sp.]|uniref:SIS domain-containing protein n=1 Tax=Aeromicrobium sp. TaxID=1871063 RepID=UPI003D6B0239
MTTETTATQMAREIAEQPEALRATLDALLPRRGEIRDRLAGRRSVLFAARGSSDNAAIYGRYLLETHAGVLGGLVSPSVATHYRGRLDLSDAVVVGVSQSGRTSEIVETLAWARSCGALTVAVTNDAGSELATSADLALTTNAGTELAVPATKSYLTQVAAMTVLGTALGPDDAALDAALVDVPDRVAAVLADADRLDPVVEQLSRGASIVTGRGLMMGTALEVALKLEETCARPVRGYSYADLRHGPISAVQEGVTAVLVGAADGPVHDAMIELADDLRTRGAITVAVGGSPELAAACDLGTGPLDVTERLAPLVAVVPMQIVIERLARHLGLDPDEPRGLSKITRTDIPTQEDT